MMTKIGLWPCKKTIVTVNDAYKIYSTIIRPKTVSFITFAESDQTAIAFFSIISTKTTLFTSASWSCTVAILRGESGRGGR